MARVKSAPSIRVRLKSAPFMLHAWNLALVRLALRRSVSIMVAELTSAEVRLASSNRARTMRLQRRHAPCRLVCFRSAQNRLTLVRSALEQFAAASTQRAISAPVRSAPDRSARAKLVRESMAPARFAPRRSAFRTLDPRRSTPARSAPSSSKAVSGFSARQRANTSGPCVTASRCSWFAIVSAPFWYAKDAALETPPRAA